MRVEDCCKDGVPMSGCSQSGDKWTCACGREWEHECDEAGGCAWFPANERVYEVRAEKVEEIASLLTGKAE